MFKELGLYKFPENCVLMLYSEKFLMISYLYKLIFYYMQLKCGTLAGILCAHSLAMVAV